MTHFEEQVMIRVCEKQTTKLAGLPNTYQEFCNSWKKRNFSETFNHVLKYRLRDTEYDMLKDAYDDNMSFEDMSKKYHTTKESLEDSLNFIISILAGTLVYKELCVGSNQYNKIFQEQRSKIDRILNADEIIYIDEMNLSYKACRCIHRELNTNKRISASDVLEKIADISKIQGIGEVTVSHIIDTFEKYGFSCIKWKKCLKRY